MLDNGNILVFDNGLHQNGFPMGWSRVLEVNPDSGKIVWSYEGGDKTTQYFYSSTMSSCQRLPNGNTLICEGPKGRFFEVTAGGEIVWEYINPFYYKHERFGHTNMTFRAYRYGPDYAGLKGTGLDNVNRVYGPEAFGLWGRPIWTGMGGASIAEVEQPTEKKEPEAKEEPKPSVARPGEKAPSVAKAEEAVRSRLQRLGY